ncbi:GNAT family N-acetyltransferase [Candidatus Sulfurimonas marisnigri]|uniref:GNAT family N-acetyltransferase n=1 Tax=Candidatus Sulfurimonas marisnigri TaxID=2740405 RepID=A0A7S7M0D3_9BACT|nr:GNAT family N-acetyltransferase [Candidatus Sulfurimonas marisnigri]QOY54775.1 GNAT family N-acetyltransferase [Candidatus Sulfurimonas marisnigri]
MLNIRELRQSELVSFFNSFKLEGFTNNVSHIKCLNKSYPNDFFIAYKDKELVGFVLAIKESEKFGRLSNLLILKKFRSQGFGKELLNFAKKHLDGCQIAIDCIQGKEQIYEAVGFKAYFETSLFSFNSGQTQAPKSNITVSNVSESSFLEHNLKLNYLKKQSYTSCLFKKSTLCKGVYNEDSLSSYAILLPYKDGYQIVLSSNEINEALALIYHLSKDLNKATSIYIEVPQTEQLLLRIVKLHDMEIVSTTTNMYNKILN